MFDRLDAGEPPRSPEEAEARAPYERLLERVRDLEDIAPPAGWEHRAMTRWSVARRTRRRGAALGAATAAVALAAVILLQLCSAPSAPGLELAVVSGSGVTRRGDAAVGDVLQVRTHAGLPHVELRIYLGTALIARCPGNPACRGDASAMQLDWALADAGMYEIVILSSSAAIPAGDGTHDRDLLDAHTAGVQIETRSLKVAL
ncbi:MAG TPA: hypothetical protein VH165_16730 [Kofleriaceae bacterium]|jgi:hypothetical protein|nr:hypothetical protein [Kofleriaceae bacterium]